MDIGTELRQAREQRGLSLPDLAARTKISLAYLRALENNDMGRLPGGVFTRGFLTAYAREVGLDAAAITQRYTAQFEPPPPPPPAAEDSGDSREKIAPAMHHLLERARPLAGVAALTLLVVLYIAFARWHSAAPPAPSESQPASTAVDAVDNGSHPSGGTPGTATALTGSSDSLASPAGTSGTVLRIELRPRDQCWISATADGKRVMYRLMRADDRQTIEVSNELVLRMGEPANLGIAINGLPGRLTARPGTPATVRITRQNYRQFLAQ